MKRIKKKRKTQELRENAMNELRKTKAKLEKEHPELLKSMRKLIEKSAQDGDAKVSKRDKAVQGKSRANTEEAEDMVRIDRQKNLETILKYAALNPGTRDLKKHLKDLLH